MVGQCALVPDLQRGRQFACKGGEQPAQPLGQRHERADDFVRFGGWQVDRERYDVALEGQHHLLGDSDAGLVLRFPGAGAQMRSYHDLVEGEQFRAPWRLGGKYVEGGAGNPAEGNCLGQGGLVDDAPSGGVDQPEAGLGVGQKFLADEPGRLGRFRDVDGDEIGLADQVVEGHQFGSHRPRPLSRQVRVVRNQSHAESQCPLRDQGSDPAQADDPEGLAVHLDAFPAGPFPAARFQRGVSLGNIAGLRQQESDGVLGGGEDVRLRGVDHHHTAPGGGGDVHVVEADARPTHHLQLAPGRQDLVINVGGRPDYERRRA